VITAAILIAVTAIGNLFLNLGFVDSNIITVYLLGVLLTSLFTRSYACSVISSVLSVILFNFFLTEPRLTLHAYGSGYPVTFIIMLAASIITGTLAARLKEHAQLSAQAAFGTNCPADTVVLCVLHQ
jgi:two-component system sensor histidine kinase KdpD